MKDSGVNVRVRATRPNELKAGEDEPVARIHTKPSVEPVSGPVFVRGPEPAKAPDGDLSASVAATTDRRMPSRASLDQQLSDIGMTWTPDLGDRSDRGLTRYTPVSIPWATTMDGALEAARNVPSLPNLSPSVRQAEQTFRTMVRQDPYGVASAYLTQVKASRQRLLARTRSAVREAVTDGLKGVDQEDASAVKAKAEHALATVPGLKPSKRAKLLTVFSRRLSEDGDIKKATQRMLDAVHVPLKIETDEIKLMSPHFTGTRVRLGDSVYDGADAAKIGPAVFNTALHPTATAVARIALEILLKETDGPLVVMAGGVAAGKGYAAKKANFDDSDAAIVFDPDGESSQTFLDTVQQIAAQTGNDVRLVGVVTDPVAAWLRALNRSFEEGRTVSETAFAHSHSTGVENMITGARQMQADGNDVVLINNNTVPKLYEGEPPAPMDLQETYSKVKDITDALDQTGRVPEWVRAQFGGNAYMMKYVIGPLEEKMQNPSRLYEKKAIFDSLKEDRRVFEYAHG